MASGCFVLPILWSLRSYLHLGLLKSGKPSPLWTRIRENDGNIENGRNGVNVKRGWAWKGTTGKRVVRMGNTRKGRGKQSEGDEWNVQADVQLTCVDEADWRTGGVEGVHSESN